MLSYLPCAVQWAGQLGDGRAISLGQAVGPDGTPYELQLKVCYFSPDEAHRCAMLAAVHIVMHHL